MINSLVAPFHIYIYTHICIDMCVPHSRTKPHCRWEFGLIQFPQHISPFGGWLLFKHWNIRVSINVFVSNWGMPQSDHEVLGCGISSSCDNPESMKRRGSLRDYVDCGSCLCVPEATMGGGQLWLLEDAGCDLEIHSEPHVFESHRLLQKWFGRVSSS